MEQSLQVTTGAETGIGVALRCRFAEQKNAVCVGQFLCKHAHQHRRARQSRRKKSVTKTVVGDIIVLAVDFNWKKKTRRITVAEHAQTQFHSAENHQWSQNARQNPE